MMTSTKDRILQSPLYKTGKLFASGVMATRLRVSTYDVSKACRELCNEKLLVMHIVKDYACYSKPVFNTCLTKPWVTYHPPCPTPDELTPSTAFIYGRPTQ